MNLRHFIKKMIPVGLFRKIEPTGHFFESLLWNIVYGWPGRGLNIIGVTGTDGKTTTSVTLYRALTSSGKKTALLSTSLVDSLDGHGEQPSLGHMTTASSRQLLQLIKQVRKQKPDLVVLETSSHALAQHRTLGLPFSMAIITNLSHEHLDYHGTMVRYAAAKRRLFKLTNKNKHGLRCGIANADDPLVAGFAALTKNPITYGIDKGDLRASGLKLSPSGSQFNALVGDTAYNIKTSLTGRFNVYNVLAVVAVLKSVGLDKLAIEQAIAAAAPVAGRMTRLELNQPFEVVIDYAVTPAALQSALNALREVVKGKVSVVFGATGDRDKAKRPVMGETVAQHADRIYLTDDETHTEDPAKIRAAVRAGIEKAGATDKIQEFDDRAAAITKAMKDAEPGDAVLITGLGHQTDRNMGGKLVPWSDEAIAHHAA